MNVLEVMDTAISYFRRAGRGRDAQDLQESRAAVAELIEALQAVLPRLAHDAICASVRPSHEWAEHGSITFDNCCCGINQVKSALAKASP